MLRSTIRVVLALLVRLFFRKVEIAGSENVPRHSGVVFAVNHPNGLIDPLFLLCFAPRPISFLAKAPLFRMPLIGFFARRLGSIPVYRRQDQLDPAKNAETFAAAGALLSSGGSVAIFPEGTTHSDPALKPLKTGAARIALAAATRSSSPILIVPTGIYYTAKATFRSAALVSFGSPFSVGRCTFDENGEPDREAVRQLTAQIDDALSEVTIEADSHNSLALVETAEQMVSSRRDEALATELALQKRLIAGYAMARERLPQPVAQLEQRLVLFAGRLREAKLDPELLGAARRPARSLGFIALRLLILALLFIAASAGSVLFLPAYVVVDLLSRRLARGEVELIATIKVLAGALFYLLNWLLVAALAAHFGGRRAFLLALLALPIVAYLTLRFWEALYDTASLLRVVLHRLTKPDASFELLEERQKIRAAIARLALDLNL